MISYFTCNIKDFNYNQKYTYNYFFGIGDKMERTYVTNNHLRSAIKEFQKYLDKDEEAPQDVFIDLMGELNVSSLLIPGRIECESLNFENLVSEEDDSCAIPLFSDDEEFIKYCGEDHDMDPIACDFGYYLELIDSLDMDGIVINIESEDFFIESELLKDYPFSQIEYDEDEEGYGPEKLQEFAKDARNDSLREFMNAGSDQFEALMNELQQSCLLNVVESDESLDGFAKDGIIAADDVDGFEMSTTEVDGEEFAILFTDIDAINETKGDDANYYVQLALLDEFFEYVLTSDMAGIIINPGKDDYVIPRGYVLDAYGGISYSNPKFKRAIDYAFSI